MDLQSVVVIVKTSFRNRFMKKLTLDRLPWAKITWFFRYSLDAPFPKCSLPYD